MSKITWNEVGERKYQTGVDRCVLYPYQAEAGTYNGGVPWNGIAAINENPSGAESTPVYADNIKYLNLTSAEDFAAGIEAFMSPEEFDECDGTAELMPGVKISQQTRKTFGLSYRTMLGNDTDGTDLGYLIHLVYGGKAAPSSKKRSTVNQTPEAMTLSWEISTTPVEVKDHKPTAHLTIDSTILSEAQLAAIEDVLYGAESSEARLPLPNEVVEILSAVG